MFPAASGGGMTSGSPRITPTSVLARKWWIISIFFVVSGAAVPAIWYFVVPEYRAMALIRVRPSVPRVVYRIEENSQVPLYESFLNTQVSIIRSTRVLQRVLDRQDIQSTEWFRADVKTITGTPISPHERLRDALSVSPRPKTELIEVAMVCEQPSEAKLMVDTVVKQYMAATKEMDEVDDNNRFKTLEDARRDLQSEIGGLIIQRATVSQRLGSNSPDQYRDHISTNLQKMKDDYAGLVRSRKLYEWEIEALESAAAESGDTGEVAETSEEIAAQQRYERDPEWVRRMQSVKTSRKALNRMLVNYGKAHPGVQESQAQVAFDEELLKERETELDDPRLSDALPTIRTLADSNVGMVPGPDRLKHLIDRTNEEASLLKEAIGETEVLVRDTNDLSMDLEKLSEQIQDKHADYEDVNARLRELQLEQKAPGRIAVEANAFAPSRPVSDRRLLMTAMAIIGALGAGVGVALLRCTFDRSVHGVVDVTSTVRGPFLGQVPKVRSESELLDGSWAPLQESVRMIRTALIERLGPRNGHGAAVLVTSASPQSGKTTMSILLGRSLAAVGKKVLVVDADLRRCALSHRLGVADENGLTDLLEGRTTDDQTIMYSDSDSMAVVPAGHTATVHHSELMSSAAFTDCLTRWRKQFDIVLFDSPPVLAVADSGILASQVDGVMMTLRSGYSRKSDAVHALAHLGAAGGKLLGSVLVGAEGGPGYDPAYGDYYEYGYGDRPRQLETTGV
jgi:capsular exopolysaccharide synthesis family protein